MLNLYDRAIELRSMDSVVEGRTLSDEIGPNRVAHTTAAQVLFLLEGTEKTDGRLWSSAFGGTTRSH